MSPARPTLAWALALTATATMAVSYVDRQAFAVLAPTITSRLGITDAMFGWLNSAFAFAYLFGAPMSGRLIDRVGARRGLLWSVLAWSTVAALHAVAPGLWALLILRVLLGLTEAPSFPAASQTVARALPPRVRSAGFGLLFTGSSFGAMAAPLLSTWLCVRFDSWRVGLLGTAVVGLAWVPLWVALTSRPGARATLDPPRSPSRPPAPATPWPTLLRQPAVLRAILIVLGSAPIGTLSLQWGAKVMVATHGIQQAQVATYLWLPPLLFDAGAVLFGLLATRAERRGDPHAPHRFLVAAAGGLALTMTLLAITRTPWQTTVIFGLALSGCGGIYALAVTDMLRRVGPADVAACAGLNASAQSMAQIVMNPIVGRVVDRTHSYRGVALALGAIAVPLFSIWILWDPRPERSRPTPVKE